MAAARGSRPRRTRPRAPGRRPERGGERGAERKRDTTRRVLLDRALALFQHRGVEGTTMRDIARAAGLSLGAAYYYFPSKEALIFAYYDANQTELEARADRATGSVRERLGAEFHAKLTSVRPHRRMLAAIVGRLVDPGDPLSALSAQQRAIRERAVGLVSSVLDGAGLSPDTARLAASALWLLEMAALLLYVHDDSPDQTRTHRLVDDALDLIVPMLPILDTPIGRSIVQRVVAALDRAGIALPAGAAPPAAPAQTA